VTLPSAVFQRITADPANARIRFFGQSVDGSADLGEDGLADLVVGSRGAVVVLRYVSRYFTAVETFKG
jgi:hypothetical protein